MKRLVFGFLVICLLLPMATGAQQSQNRNTHRCSLTGLLPDLPFADLSDEEAADLVFMREEEKLARDVYLSLHQEWELRIHRQIARAEKTHMRALLYHLRKYEIDDPAAGNGIGVFSNPTLQQLYELLIQQGTLSVGDSLLVGAAIEELDIHDLQEALTRTDNADLETVYQNLLKGSRNHLQAFHKVLMRNGLQYTPEYLTQDEYDEIVQSAKEKGVVDASGDSVCGGGGQRLGAG